MQAPHTRKTIACPDAALFDLRIVVTMATPSISLPPEQPIALPELPPELLLTLLTKKHAASTSPSSRSGPPERDALDSFVLSGAGGLGEGAGGIQVEDVLNELLPNGV